MAGGGGGSGGGSGGGGGGGGSESVSANVGIFDGEDGALSAGGSTSEGSPDRDVAGTEDDLAEWLRSKARAFKCVLATQESVGAIIQRPKVGCPQRSPRARAS